jgi:hypothetical protein
MSEKSEGEKEIKRPQVGDLVYDAKSGDNLGIVTGYNNNGEVYFRNPQGEESFGYSTEVIIQPPAPEKP